MSKEFGWWVDLTKVVLTDSDAKASSWVHALPFGTYQHPLHGELHFDTSKLSALATSVKDKVRGIVPDIDYEHKTDPTKGNQAAGWVGDAEVRTDGLYLHVDWTPDAAKEIREGKYRYFSAEFTDTWTDNLGKIHENVLLGGGLTNRPYMKNLLPVNLSELSFNQPEGGQDEVDPKKLRIALGLAETTTDDEVFTKLTELGTSITALTADKTKLEGEKTTLEAELAKLKEPDVTDPALKQLIDSSPAFKKLVEDMQDKDKKLSEAQTSLKLAEVSTKLAELQSGKRFALAPTSRDKLRDALVKLSGDGYSTLFEFVKSVVDGTALVDLSERGYMGRRLEGDGDATKRFNDAVVQLREKNKDMSIGDAVEQIARDNPELYTEHRQQATAFQA